MGQYGRPPLALAGLLVYECTTVVKFCNVAAFNSISCDFYQCCKGS